jgi:hypothetical protein
MALPGHYPRRCKHSRPLEHSPVINSQNAFRCVRSPREFERRITPLCARQFRKHAAAQRLNADGRGRFRPASYRAERRTQAYFALLPWLSATREDIRAMLDRRPAQRFLAKNVAVSAGHLHDVWTATSRTRLLPGRKATPVRIRRHRKLCKSSISESRQNACKSEDAGRFSFQRSREFRYSAAMRAPSPPDR